MSATGFKYEQFNLHVCSCFETKMLNDQLCYEVNLNNFSDNSNIENELKLGFNFLMDYNEDRQVTLDHNIVEKELGLANNVAASDEDQHAFVFLDTIGRNNIFTKRNYESNKLLI